MLVKAPCHNCEDRCIGCHSICDRYAEFRAYKDMISREHVKAVDERSFHLEQIIRKTKKRTQH